MIIIWPNVVLQSPKPDIGKGLLKADSTISSQALKGRLQALLLHLPLLDLESRCHCAS